MQPEALEYLTDQEAEHQLVRQVYPDGSVRIACLTCHVVMYERHSP